MNQSTHNLKSMTGFGKASFEFKGKTINVEIRSLNSKQIDINTRLTNSFKAKELEIRSMLTEKLERGKIDIIINIDNNGEVSNHTLNKKLINKYFKELKSISGELKIKDPDFLQLIMRMPDIMATEVNEMDEKEWKLFKSAVDKAIKLLDDFRIHEGKILEVDFKNRINLINKLLKDIKSLDKARIKNIREKMLKDLNEIINNKDIDKNRFEQELIYYIEKLDITEEIIRLKKHCDYFIATMNETSCGKKLGFIGQEIGREINTIGSKANDADIQMLVVQMKDELEKIKEQLMNIL